MVKDIGIKICLDNVVFSLQQSGGISVVWCNIIERLLQNNVPFECLEYGNATKNIFRKSLNIPSPVIRPYSHQLLCVTRYLPVNIAGNDPFIFHSSYYRYCTNPNARNITTVHDFTYEYFTSGMFRKIHCYQKYDAIRHSDVIVCISENTKQDLLRFVPDVDPSKIRVIYNGVSEDYSPLAVKDSRYSDYVLFVGARKGYKNFKFVVNAIKNTPYKLAVCGRALSSDELEFLNGVLGHSRYKIFENIDNRELNKLYNSVYCLAYPSSYEGFGIPVLEAQRAGCPVIALDSSSIPEVIGETPLLMARLAKEEFISKLQLLQDTNLRQEIVTMGIENSQRFSWRKMADSYLNLYRELSRT